MKLRKRVKMKAKNKFDFFCDLISKVNFDRMRSITVPNGVIRLLSTEAEAWDDFMSVINSHY